MTKTSETRLQIGGLGYRLRVRPDKHRGGFEAALLTDDGGLLMHPNGSSALDATARLVRELAAGDSFERKIAKEIKKASTKAHATKAHAAVTKGPAAWAHEHLSEANTPEELAKIWAVMSNPWTGMGRYYTTRSGVAKAEIDAVYQQQRERLGMGSSNKSAHATKVKAIPGITKWHMTAGGTGAAPGKHGYTLHPPEGDYYITPYTGLTGRHQGYLLQFAATHGRPRAKHGFGTNGLWHDLGSHSSPQKAATAAAAHYAKGFD